MTLSEIRVANLEGWHHGSAVPRHRAPPAGDFKLEGRLSRTAHASGAGTPTAFPSGDSAGSWRGCCSHAGDGGEGLSFDVVLSSPH